MMAAYDSLLAAVRTHSKFTGYSTKEDPQDFLRRLTAAVADLPLADFEGLAPEAQDWYDRAADALQAGQAVPVPDSFAPETAAPGRIVRPSASGTSARHVVPKTAHPVDPAEPLATQVSRLMIGDPQLSIDGVMDLLRGAEVGAKRNSVVTLRNQALIFLRIIREEGWQPPHH